MLFKYPKTFHFPWSPGTSSADRILESTQQFQGKEVVLTEKLDGENTSMYRDHFHARSLDSRNHPSRNLVKGLWGGIAHLIPQGWRICGENMFAKHSIFYDRLTAYFYVFAVYNEHNFCLSWPDTVQMASDLGLEVVPVEFVGLWSKEKFSRLNPLTEASAFGDTKEGYVIRTVEGFGYNDFQNHVGKWVRPHHVQTDQLWMNQPVVPNKLR